MAQTPHNQESSHHLGSSPSTGPRTATSLSTLGAVGGTQPVTRAAMLAPAPASLQGREPHKARSVGSFGADRASGRRRSQQYLPSVHDTSLNPSGLTGLQK